MSYETGTQLWRISIISKQEKQIQLIMIIIVMIAFCILCRCASSRYGFIMQLVPTVLFLVLYVKLSAMKNIYWQKTKFKMPKTETKKQKSNTRHIIAKYKQIKCSMQSDNVFPVSNGNKHNLPCYLILLDHQTDSLLSDSLPSSTIYTHGPILSINTANSRYNSAKYQPLHNINNTIIMGYSVA